MIDEVEKGHDAGQAGGDDRGHGKLRAPWPRSFSATARPWTKVKTMRPRQTRTGRWARISAITRGERLALAIWTATRRMENTKTTKVKTEATRPARTTRAPSGRAKRGHAVAFIESAQEGGPPPGRAAMPRTGTTHKDEATKDRRR